MAAPAIPPRPARTQNLSTSSANMDIPKIPPRPKRNMERSVSPNCDSFARSPLNDPSFPHNGFHQQKEDFLGTNLPQRPPSVSLPSIGQEGSEYANLQDFSDESSPKQTKNVAGDLPLYAPTASVPISTAKSRIATVTRTDSSQAAAISIGKLLADADEKAGTTSSVRSGSSAGTHTRPQSIYKDDEEHGIPEIGVRVPMYPNAGDVQAPTPSPMTQAPSTGVGFFNNGSQASVRHHGRTKSGREIFHGPPGSYGMHGHGVGPRNEFQKTWYEKHPDDFAREKQGEYGRAVPENRKDYHWVGDDLSKLVHESASRGIGMGTSREAISTPDENIGYMASEEYASRMASPRPSSARPPSIHAKDRTSSADDEGTPKAAASEHALESEAEDDVIHIDPPSHRADKIGGGGYDPPKEDLGPEGGNTEEEGGWVTERGYGAPILASDEMAKHPEAEYMQPAVSPELERRGSGEYTLNDSEGVLACITSRKSVSRGSSRTNSIHGGTPSLSRFASSDDNDRIGTPLDNVKEYEPLFPEDEEEHEKHERPLTAADKLKRPNLARHHFPSQDVWEDTPSSLQLQTTVESPQAPEEPRTPKDQGSAQAFENPEVEAQRKQEITDDDKTSFLPEPAKRFAKPRPNPDVADGVTATGRPGMAHRFPSHDIWEDTAESLQLVTTVSGPQTDETAAFADDTSPIAAAAAAGAATTTTAIASKPTILARPARPTAATKDVSPTGKKPPIVPDRPKPTIPGRPGRTLAKTPSNDKESPASAPPNTTTSDSASDVSAKPKPSIPARPTVGGAAGGKLAALKAGFMSDLNSRLQLGPQVPKAPEPVREVEAEPVERAPLADARKGRAKGPQRRKPAAGGAGEKEAERDGEEKKAVELSFVAPCTLWEIQEGGAVDVPAAEMAKVLREAVGGVDLPRSSAEPIAAAAAAAAAASTKEAEAEPEAALSASSSTSTAAVQTGQQDVMVENTGGSTEKMTAFPGGRVPEEGAVVVKDGVEHLGAADTTRAKGIETASDGGVKASGEAREEASAAAAE